MDPTKAELESTIRLKRARLDRKLARLEGRIDEVKHNSKLAAVITGAVILASALAGTVAIVVRSILRRRRRHRGIVLFPR
jgi:hypothetical protein